MRVVQWKKSLQVTRSRRRNIQGKPQVDGIAAAGRKIISADVVVRDATVATRKAGTKQKLVEKTRLTRGKKSQQIHPAARRPATVVHNRSKASRRNRHGRRIRIIDGQQSRRRDRKRFSQTCLQNKCKAQERCGHPWEFHAAYSAQQIEIFNQNPCNDNETILRRFVKTSIFETRSHSRK